jgi:ribose-phosphate pyrophosphokinase
MVFYECEIIADPESKAWKFAEDVYNYLKKKSNKFNLNEVHVKKFNDGEMFVKIKDNVRRHNCFYIHDSAKNPPDWFLELGLVNHTLKNSSAKEIVDVLPYLKFSRQDRKDQSRVPISAKMLADYIGLYGDGVLTLDVHNPSIQGFYDVAFDSLYSFPTVVEYFKQNHPEMLDNVVVGATDVGSGKRARSFARKTGIEDIVIGDKVREKAGKVKKTRLMGNVKGKNVLIIEDIIDSGGTLISYGKKLKEKGAEKIIAYATHGIFSKGIEELVDYLDLIVIGDTIINPEIQHPKIEKVSFVELFGEAIYRINEGESLSVLFDDEEQEK